MRLRSVPCCVALAALAVTAFATPAAAAPDEDTFSCRASAARVVALGINLEPFVANRPEVPCVTDEEGLINPTDIGPLRLSVLSARTFANPEGIPGTFSETEVLDLRLPVAGDPVFGALPAIHAEALNTKAEVTCAHGEPLFNSASKVVNLQIGDEVIAIPTTGEPFMLDLVIAQIYVNERITTPTSVTRRALRVSSALLGLDVVVAESKANVEGNPCKKASPPPHDKPLQASAAQAKPACSDGKDSDGDKRADAKDPGCHSDRNPKNRRSYNPKDNSEYNKTTCTRKKKGNGKSSKRLSCKKDSQGKKGGARN